jgi:hypothetical protein
MSADPNRTSSKRSVNKQLLKIETAIKFTPEPVELAMGKTPSPDDYVSVISDEKSKFKSSNFMAHELTRNTVQSAV